MNSDYTYKHIIIGDSMSGKTSYFNKLIHNTYTNSKISTIGVDFGVLYISINDKLIKNHFWDTAGQETYKSIIRTYYRGAYGCIIMFDITNYQSFDNVKRWIEDVQNYGNYNKLSIIIVGNKSDLNIKRAITIEEAEEFCNKNNLKYFDISVKDNINIKESFNYLINLISTKEKNYDIIENEYIKKESFEIVAYNNKKKKKCLDCVIS